MNVQSLKTEPVVVGSDLFELLDTHLADFKDGSILAVTSKIIAICEGSVAKVDEVDKAELIKSEADRYIPAELSRYGLYLTIKDGVMLANSGLDESNGNGFYILWPKDSQATANQIRAYLKKRFNIKNAGVVITDSRNLPLRWGVTGVALASSGFKPLKSYIDTPDIFGHHLRMTTVSIRDGLAIAAVLVMGEGNECTPLAIINNAPFVEFVDADPTEEELAQLLIDPEDDIYAPILQSAGWVKNK